MSDLIKPFDRPANLADRVYQQLRDLIGSHRIRPGERLQEAALVVQLGVSRTPVREALARLESEEMILSVGRGFVIPELSDVDIDEIYELRFILEPVAVRSAVEAVTDADEYLTLAAAVDDAIAAERSGNIDAFIDANDRYYNAWRSLVPNRRMCRHLDQYTGSIRFLRLLTLTDSGARRAALTGLKKIDAAFRKRDGDAAARAMRQHLETAKKFLCKTLDKIEKEKEAERYADEKKPETRQTTPQSRNSGPRI